MMTGSKVKRALKYRERRRLGLCYLCGEEPFLPAMGHLKLPMCGLCYCKRTSYKLVKDRTHYALLLYDRFLDHPFCPYTGEGLVLGGNTAIDHIYPVSRFPDRAQDPDNWEWVTRTSNMAKHNMTKDEFGEFCRIVTNYRESA